MFNQNLFGEDVAPEKQGGGLAAHWDYPPFSVLNAREGWWQERKRQWLALGIKSELGRGGGQHGESTVTGLTWGNSPEITKKGLNFYRDKNRGQER
jgi:hypothetical protein